MGFVTVVLCGQDSGSVGGIQGELKGTAELSLPQLLPPTVPPSVPPTVPPCSRLPGPCRRVVRNGKGRLFPGQSFNLMEREASYIVDSVSWKAQLRLTG